MNYIGHYVVILLDHTNMPRFHQYIFDCNTSHKKVSEMCVFFFKNQERKKIIIISDFKKIYIFFLSIKGFRNTYIYIYIHVMICYI